MGSGWVCVRSGARVEVLPTSDGHIEHTAIKASSALIWRVIGALFRHKAAPRCTPHPCPPLLPTPCGACSATSTPAYLRLPLTTTFIIIFHGFCRPRLGPRLIINSPFIAHPARSCHDSAQIYIAPRLRSVQRTHRVSHTDSAIAGGPVKISKTGFVYLRGQTIH